MLPIVPIFVASRSALITELQAAPAPLQRKRPDLWVQRGPEYSFSLSIARICEWRCRGTLGAFPQLIE